MTPRCAATRRCCGGRQMRLPRHTRMHSAAAPCWALALRRPSAAPSLPALPHLRSRPPRWPAAATCRRCRCRAPLRHRRQRPPPATSRSATTAMTATPCRIRRPPRPPPLLAARQMVRHHPATCGGATADQRDDAEPSCLSVVVPAPYPLRPPWCTPTRVHLVSIRAVRLNACDAQLDVSRPTLHDWNLSGRRFRQLAPRGESDAGRGGAAPVCKE